MCIFANKRERVHEDDDDDYDYEYDDVCTGEKRRREKREKRKKGKGKKSCRWSTRRDEGSMRGERRSGRREGERKGAVEARKGGENKLLPRQRRAQWEHLLSKLRKIITFARDSVQYGRGGISKAVVPRVTQ